MLALDNTLLVLIDLQVKVAQAMHNREILIKNIEKLIKGIITLEVPILWVEHNPDALGPTVQEVAELLPSKPITKLSFSCYGEPRFRKALKQLGRRQILLAGIEMHVCIYQTAAALLVAGYEVHVVADAVSSRRPQDKEIGLQKVKDAGGVWTSVETVLFELLKVAEGTKFKEILKIVK